MSLIKCSHCGREIARTAPTCPGCGAAGSPQTSGCTKFILAALIVLAGAWVFNAVTSEPSKPATPEQIAQRKAERQRKELELSELDKAIEEARQQRIAIRAMVTVESKWERGGFGNVGVFNLTLKNANDIQVRDIPLLFTFYSDSGREIGRVEKEILKVIPAGGKIVVKDFSVGFIDQQATNASVSVIPAR